MSSTALFHWQRCLRTSSKLIVSNRPSCTVTFSTISAGQATVSKWSESRNRAICCATPETKRSSNCSHCSSRHLSHPRWRSSLHLLRSGFSPYCLMSAMPRASPLLWTFLACPDWPLVASEAGVAKRMLLPEALLFQAPTFRDALRVLLCPLLPLI